MMPPSLVTRAKKVRRISGNLHVQNMKPPRPVDTPFCAKKLAHRVSDCPRVRYRTGTVYSVKRLTLHTGHGQLLPFQGRIRLIYRTVCNLICRETFATKYSLCSDRIYICNIKHTIYEYIYIWKGIENGIYTYTYTNRTMRKDMCLKWNIYEWIW